MLATMATTLLMTALALRHASADTYYSKPVAAPSEVESDFLSEDALRQKFEESDFVFGFDLPPEEAPGGTLRPNVISTNPFLGTLPGDGNGQNLVTLEACGVNQPHVHPRGTETSFITEGELFFGLVEENGGREVSTTLERGMSISIPQGLIHFAQNLGCERAQFLANFPNRDPGTVTIASNFIRLPESVIRGTLNVDDDTIEALRAGIESSPNPSIDPECAKRCGLSTD